VIQSKPATPEYRDGWERVFGKKPRPPRWFHPRKCLSDESKAEMLTNMRRYRDAVRKPKPKGK
jgi:hypothetical protein